MTQALATLADLYRLGISSDVLAQSPRSGDTATQSQAIDSASEYALGKIGGRYKRPLVSWQDDLRQAVCKLAAYELLCIRGFNPAAGADINILERRNQADAWLTSVARQEISPDIVGAANQSPQFDNPRIVTSIQQGWQNRAGRVIG
jgi:phage gp36-like protein